MYRKLCNLIRNKFTPLDVQARRVGVSLGKGCAVYSRFWSTEPYLISIGDYCQITGGVKILTHGGGHVLRKDIPDFDVFGKVVIGSWVYIGFNALIMPGVTIGNNVLIAAGSVVTKSVPSNVVVGGNPAHIISSIEKYQSNNQYFNLNSKSLSAEEKRRLLLSVNDSKFIKKGLMEI